MITSFYDLDTVEEAFDVALMIDLTFKRLVNAKARCSKCEGNKYYDYQCPSKSRHVRIVPSNNVDDLKVIENVNILLESTSIIEDTLVDFGAPIIDEVHMLLIVPVMT